MLVNKTEKIERSFASKLRGYFSRMQKEAIKQLKNNGKITLDKEYWRNELKRIYEEETLKSLAIGYKRAQRELDKLHKSVSDLELLEIAYFEEYGERLVIDIDNTTHRKIEEVLKEAMVEGLAIQEIVAQIAKLFDNFKGARARTIARTEVARASNYGYLEQMRQAGFKKKKYITAQDELVCPICRPLNRKVVAIETEFNSTFEDGGKIINLSAKFPPLHPNCRCTLVVVSQTTSRAKDKLIKLEDEFFKVFKRDLQSQYTVSLLKEFFKKNGHSREYFMQLLRLLTKREVQNIDISFADLGGDTYGESFYDYIKIERSLPKELIFSTFLHEATHLEQFAGKKKGLGLGAKEMLKTYKELFDYELYKQVVKELQSRGRDIEQMSKGIWLGYIIRFFTEDRKRNKYQSFGRKYEDFIDIVSEVFFRKMFNYDSKSYFNLKLRAMLSKNPLAYAFSDFQEFTAVLAGLLASERMTKKEKKVLKDFLLRLLEERNKK